MPDWLTKAYDLRDIGLVTLYLKTNPMWDPLRGDARFDELLSRLGLAP